MVQKGFAVRTGISIREFARRDGCSDALVRRALKSGHLQALENGTLDPAQVGTGWREGNRRGANPGANSAHPVRTPCAPDADEALDPQPHGGALRRLRRPEDENQDGDALGQLDELLAARGHLCLAEAERLKENYLALLRQLEYDTKAALVVPVAEVAAEVGQAFATVRTKLLALPAEHAPRLHRLKTVAELQDALARLITEAIEELSRAGALRPRG